MKRVHCFSLLLLFCALLLTWDCSSKKEKPKLLDRPIETVGGTITANPNPIQVCDGTGLGITKLTWTAMRSATQRVEVRVNAPDGPLFSHTLGAGAEETGKWVGDGTVFYLQDVTNSLPLIVENTLATVKVSVTTAGCK